ncbi:FHA domain-containing protein [Roseimaritima sediminicola]|uniref:FHA domain-containing protein n=1 Tax=Roseimaritima sediminicola TaxID=2662066 RepID=UPI0012984802|nr:FHA domain-containing protein [Roseimaritima sediminicola]
MSSIPHTAPLDSQSAAALQLFATGPAGEQRSVALQPNTGVFIGASHQCGLRLRGPEIAEIHCRITYQDGCLTVQEWMHACGTRVNGQTVDGEHVLEADDCLEVGPYRITVNRSVQTPTEARPSPGDAGPAAAAAEATADEAAPEENLADLTPDSLTPDLDLDISMLDSEFDAMASDEDEMFDRETVDLLRAEVAHLQAALAAQEAQHRPHPQPGDRDHSDAEAAWDAEHSFSSDPLSNESSAERDEPDACLRRMEELIDEANRSDERVAILEEMLQAAELANRFEQEERAQLEAWVGDIEKRVGQREQEHLAETESLKARLQTGEQQVHQLQRKLHRVATEGGAAAADTHTLEELQATNQQLQLQVLALEKQNAELNRKLASASTTEDTRLREERAELAKQHAELSRLRFEVSSKLADFESLPKTQTGADKEAATRIHALREHLREIHQQESAADSVRREASLSGRLSRLWNRLQ